MAMNVSAQATPMPETMPERRLFDSVRWMQSTATGPTVIEAATPTQMPRNRVSTISNFFGLLRVSDAPVTYYRPCAEDGPEKGVVFGSAAAFRICEAKIQKSSDIRL